MVKIGYLFAKFLSKILVKRKYEVVNQYFRKGGAHIGSRCVICSNLDLCEKELLYFGDNVIVSSDVLFVTHDVSVSRFVSKRGSLFGRISIGDNCFIGERATILYGVTLANNIIVAAGAVVTHSFDEEGIIIGGNPARKIGIVSEFVERNLDKILLVNEMKKANKNNEERLIKR